MAEESPPANGEAPGPAIRTRLLLIEDEPDYATVLQEALTTGSTRFQVSQAQRLDEALQQVAAGSVDVALLDLSLPDSHGLETVTRLHAAAPELPLVVLTGVDDGALAARAIQEGAQDYLVKGRVDVNLLRYSLSRAIDRKHRDQALKADEERFRKMVMGVGDYAIFLLDPAGRVATWNVGAQRIAGFRPEEIIGHHFSSLYLNEDQLLGKPEWALKVATAQGRYEEEGPRVGKDGARFWSEVVITALRDPQGVIYGFSHVMRDATARKEAVEALQQARDELEQRVEQRAEELARANEALQQSVTRLQQLDQMKDRFLAIVTHELRAPIQSIIGYTELLQGGIMPPDQVEDALATIHQSALNQVSLINNLLDLAKLDAGQLKIRPRPTDVAVAIRDALRMFRYHTDQKRLTLRVELPPDLPPVQADPERLRQILINLIGNAIKFSPAGEEICIRAELADGQVRVQVADSGIGIAEQDYELIFKQFGQVESAQTQGIKGTGLGLPITKSLIELMGGRIWVKSSPGKGSSFYFTVPVVTSPAASPG